MPADRWTIPAAMIAAALSAAGCEGLGFTRPPAPLPPVEKTEVVEPDPTAALAAGPFSDDASLHRSLQSDGAIDRPVGGKGREFARVGVTVASAALSPDGTWLAVGGADGAVRIDPLYGHGAGERSWESPPAARFTDDTRIPPRPLPVNALAYFRSADAYYLAAAGAGGTVHVWALGRNGVPLESTPARRNPLVIRAADNELHALACHPLRPIVAAAGADGQVRCFQLADGRRIGRVPVEGHRNSVKALDFSPDGAVLASADDEGVVLLWQSSALLAEPAPAGVPQPKAKPAKTEKTEKIEKPGEGGPTMPTGGAAAGGGAAAESVPAAARLSTGSKAGTSGAAALAFSPAGREPLLLVAGTRDGRLWLWKMSADKPESAALVHADAEGGEARHAGAIRSAAFSPDGRFVATGGSDGAARLWMLEGQAVRTSRLVDAKTDKTVKELGRETLPRRLVSVGDFNRGAAAAGAGAFRGEVCAVKFTADGVELLAASDRSIALYRARTLDGRALAVGRPGAGRAIDWTRPAPPAAYTVVAALVSDPVRDGTHVIRVRLNNTATRKDADLYQVVGLTECRYPPVGDPNFNRSRPVPGLHGRPVYFGKIPAGGSAAAEIRLTPEEALPYGDYEVVFHWQHAHQPAPVRAGSVRIPVGAQRLPTIVAAYHLQEETVEPDGVLQFGERASAALFIKNVGSATAENIRVKLTPAAESENADAAPFSLEIRGDAAELNIGDLRPGEYRRRVFGPLAIKSAGNPGAQLPETSLPVKLTIAGAGANGMSLERALRIAVAPPLEESGPPRPIAEHYRTADPDERESAVVQFRSGPGAETPVVAETSAGRVGSFAAEGARGAWIRVRLPADLMRRLQGIEFQQPYVWVKRADVVPAPKPIEENLDALRAVPYGDDAPAVDHNLPESRRIRGAVFFLRGNVFDKDGLRRVTVTIDRTEERVLFDAAAGPGKGPRQRFVIPKTEIDFSNHLRREIVITAEDNSPSRHRQQVRVVLEREGG